MKPTFLLAGTGIAILWLVGYNLIYAPQQVQMRLIQAQRAEEQATQQTQAEVAALLQQVEQYRKRLPQEPDPSLLVKDVVELAQRSGVQLKSIVRDAPQVLPQFTRLLVHLDVSASYHQLGTFLDDLERSEHFMRVEHLTVTRQANNGPAAIQLTVIALYVPPVLQGF